MKLISLLSLFILILVGNLELYSQIIISTINENDHVTITTEALKVQVQKNPWCISVYDKNDMIILNEKENNLFVFSDDKISEYVSYSSSGYDTIIKRDPPLYHLYNESVIIGESVLFECTTANSKNVNVYITYRSPYVFSVWMTLPDNVATVKHSFVSDESEHFFGLGECWDARSLDLKGLSVTMNNRTGTPDQGGYIPFYVSTNGYGLLVDNNLNVDFNFSDDNVLPF